MRRYVQSKPVCMELGEGGVFYSVQYRLMHPVMAFSFPLYVHGVIQSVCPTAS